MTPPAGPGIASGDCRSPLFLRAPPLGPRRDTGSSPAPPRPSTTAPCLPPGRAGPGAASSSGPLTRASSVARRSHPLALWATWALPVPPALPLALLAFLATWRFAEHPVCIRAGGAGAVGSGVAEHPVCICAEGTGARRCGAWGMLGGGSLLTLPAPSAPACGQGAKEMIKPHP